MEGIYDNLQRLPPGWQRVKIGDEIEVIRGASPRPKGDPRYFGGSIPWIMISDVTKENGKFISKTRDHVTEEGAGKSRYLKAGTLILSNSATVCVPKILGVDGCIHDGFVAFPNLPKRFDILYLYYFFEFIRSRVIDAHRQGITQVNLNTTIVKNIQVPIAPPNEQKRIVAEIEKQFSLLDEAVANLKRVKANLKRYKAAVLKAAVEGRLTEDWRKQHSDVEPASELLKRILAERRAKWKGKGKYSEPVFPDMAKLPNLPKGWSWISAAQLSSAEAYSFAIGPFGSNLKVSDYTTSGGVPLIFVRNIRSSLFGTGETVFVANEKAEQLRAHHVSGGDVLITKMGDPPGDACLYPETATDAIITADCIKLRPSPLIQEKRFIVHAINSYVVKSQILGITKGVAQLKVSLARFRSIGIPLPPLPEQEEIVADVERRFSVIDELHGQVAANLQRTDRFRQSILNRAFEGKLVSFERAGTSTLDHLPFTLNKPPATNP